VIQAGRKVENKVIVFYDAKKNSGLKKLIRKISSRISRKTLQQA
jgi:hypothetical protein